MIDVARRVSCVRVQMIDVVLVEAPFLAVQDVAETGWLGEAEDAISVNVCQWTGFGTTVTRRRYLRRLRLRGTNDSNAFGHHHLIARMGVQIERAHEAALSGMRMNPAELQQILLHAEVEHLLLIRSLTCVACADLLRNHQVADKQGVVDTCAA